MSITVLLRRNWALGGRWIREDGDFGQSGKKFEIEGEDRGHAASICQNELLGYDKLFLGGLGGNWAAETVQEFWFIQKTLCPFSLALPHSLLPRMPRQRSIPRIDAFATSEFSGRRGRGYWRTSATKYVGNDLNYLALGSQMHRFGAAFRGVELRGFCAWEGQGNRGGGSGVTVWHGVYKSRELKFNSPPSFPSYHHHPLPTLPSCLLVPFETEYIAAVVDVGVGLGGCSWARGWLVELTVSPTFIFSLSFTSYPPHSLRRALATQHTLRIFPTPTFSFSHFFPLRRFYSTPTSTLPVTVSILDRPAFDAATLAAVSTHPTPTSTSFQVLLPYTTPVWFTSK
ncbi:hypothetical protein R3P38DRAFT_3211749 [Favolaschia claudopus]|uniref:Uncharacterized protein n=1 Tax=Favolaschia claudopus TaxID=2862362 RepID=A0AAW0AFI1_9AGAR